MQYPIIALYTLLAFLLLDVISTIIALSTPGNGLTEGNSIMARLFARFGVVPVLLVTHIGVGGLMWFCTVNLAQLPAIEQQLWPVLLTGLAVFYGRTDYSNFKLIKGAQ